MLATDLVATAPTGALIAALSREELDITDERAIDRALGRHRPEWVINAAAYTKVDGAEADYSTAHAVNATAVRALGRLCAERGIAVLHYSTDYVFAGDGRSPYTESDLTSPVNAYGRSKLAGEQGLLSSGARALILRTQWLFGLTGRSFPRTMWERATQDLETRVVADQFGRPTSTTDLARASWTLIERGAAGVYHVANAGTASWFDVASTVFAKCGCRRLRPCTSADYPTPARRPAFSVLNTRKLEHDHSLRLQDWRVALESLLESLRGESCNAAT